MGLAELDTVRLRNNLCDALARNGFWWDRQGRVHDCYDWAERLELNAYLIGHAHPISTAWKA